MIITTFAAAGGVAMLALASVGNADPAERSFYVGIDVGAYSVSSSMASLGFAYCF